MACSPLHWSIWKGKTACHWQALAVAEASPGNGPEPGCQSPQRCQMPSQRSARTGSRPAQLDRGRDRGLGRSSGLCAAGQGGKNRRDGRARARKHRAGCSAGRGRRQARAQRQIRQRRRFGAHLAVSIVLVVGAAIPAGLAGHVDLLASCGSRQRVCQGEDVRPS